MFENQFNTIDIISTSAHLLLIDNFCLMINTGLKLKVEVNYLIMQKKIETMSLASTHIRK